MAAGRQSSSSITIAYDDGPGGTARTITGFVLSMGGVKITQNMEPALAFGLAWEAHASSGVGKVDKIELEGFWDTTATTGPHVVFLTPDSDPNGATRTLTIGFGDSKTFATETRLESYEVMGKAGNLTRFKATIQPTGTPAWT